MTRNALRGRHRQASPPHFLAVCDDRGLNSVRCQLQVARLFKHSYGVTHCGGLKQRCHPPPLCCRRWCGGAAGAALPREVRGRACLVLCAPRWPHEPCCCCQPQGHLLQPRQRQGEAAWSEVPCCCCCWGFDVSTGLLSCLHCCSLVETLTDNQRGRRLVQRAEHSQAHTHSAVRRKLLFVFNAKWCSSRRSQGQVCQRIWCVLRVCVCALLCRTWCRACRCGPLSGSGTK
jgi:hypothetical protein